MGFTGKCYGHDIFIVKCYKARHFNGNCYKEITVKCYNASCQKNTIFDLFRCLLRVQILGIKMAWFHSTRKMCGKLCISLLMLIALPLSPRDSQ